MKPTDSGIDEFLTALAGTPRRIHARTSGLSDAKLRFSPDKNTWSAAQILAHLRSCADVWGLGIARMLAEDNPTLPYYHPRRWIKKTDYPELGFHVSFEAFAVQRTKLIRVLKDLSFQDWSRGAKIKGREHTVFSEVRRLSKHESEHCGQIEELLKR